MQTLLKTLTTLYVQALGRCAQCDDDAYCDHCAAEAVAWMNTMVDLVNRLYTYEDIGESMVTRIIVLDDVLSDIDQRLQRAYVASLSDDQDTP